MTLKDKTNEIKNELKKIGYSNRKVSVKGRYTGYSEAIDITIKDIFVDKNRVKKIANRFANIHYDDYTGEILSGGNTYIRVKFDSDLIDKYAEDYIDFSAETMEKANKICKTEFDDYTVAKNDEISIYYSPNNKMLTAWKNNGSRIKACMIYDKESFARILTSYIIEEKFIKKTDLCG